MGLVYRDQLFPREAYRRAFEVLLAAHSERQACRIMVDILALAHERACEAELAKALEDDLEAGRLPEMADLRGRFMPDPGSLLQVTVPIVSLDAYQALLSPAGTGEAA